MTAENFKQWQPYDAFPQRVEIMSICDEDEGLCVTLASEKARELVAKLVFQDFVAYRNVNESFRLRTWRSKMMAGMSSLLIVEPSLWLNWLREESGGILDDIELTHYAIYTNDDCLDVATRAAPLIVTSIDDDVLAHRF